jgi:hypothetical protein
VLEEGRREVRMMTRPNGMTSEHEVLPQMIGAA